MKILCIVQRYYPVIGGAENHAKKFVEHLQKNHDVDVFTTNALNLNAFWNKNEKKIHLPNNSDENINRFNFLTPEQLPISLIENFPLSSLHPGPFLADLWSDLITKSAGYDLIHVISFPYAHVYPAIFAAKKWNIPIIITPLVHQEFPELFLTGLKLSILNEANSITVSTRSEKKLLEKNGIDKEKIFLIPPASEYFEIDQSEFRSKHNISSTTKVILFVGMKSKDKGIITLIDSMIKLWNENNDCVLVVIGQDTTEYDQFIKKLPNKFKNNLIDLKSADEETKNRAFHDCDIFALPSKTESFGISYLEAWNFGKPVIGCDIISTRELISDGSEGLLIPFGDVEKLKNSILGLMKNSSERTRLGNNGKIKSKQFTWEKSCKDFEELCLKTIKH